MAENPLADPPKPKATFPILEADAVVDAPPAYHPKDAIAESFRSAKFTGAAGLLLAAVQNTLARENVGAFGVFTKFGGTIALFTAMGGTFAFVSTASANLREKEDAYNPGLGGFFAGALVGLRKRTVPSVLGNGVLLGVALAGAQFTGGAIFSQRSDPDEDQFVRKEEIRRRFRRPANELINEIGEGRGIYGAGYEERRKQRIKDAYGIEVQDPYYKSS